MLVALLGGLIALAFGALLADDPVQGEKRFAQLKSVLDVLVGPLITLLSTVIGFYFGAQTAKAAAEYGKK